MMMATTASNKDDVGKNKQVDNCKANLSVRFAANIAETLVYDDPPPQCDTSDDLFGKNSPVATNLHCQKQEHQEPASRLVEIIRGQLYFFPSADMTLIQEFTRTAEYKFMTSTIHNMYDSFCDDFGPVAICQVIYFCRAMSKAVQSSRDPSSSVRRKVVYYCDKSPRCCSNTVFLIVSYLVLELGWNLDTALTPFDHLDPSFTEPFRDATWINPPQHLLSVRDCVKGLFKALANGWLDDFDVAQYEHMGDPFFGDVNSVCPKFIAFKGPVEAKDIPKGDLSTFPPHFYAHVFERLDIECVIRLNEPCTYDPAPFQAVGIMHYDLFFEDCTSPSFALVTKFLDICDRHQGKIAVHCTAGLGRTGTMLAVWLMRKRGFRANEAMGFLRVMRPGSVIGPQQTFLQHLETASWNNNTVLPVSACHDFHRVFSLDDARPSFKRSTSAESCNRALVRRTQSEPGPDPASGAGRLFENLMRVQKKAAERDAKEKERALAQKMAEQVQEGMQRRAAKGGGSFRNAKVGFRLTESASGRSSSLNPPPCEEVAEMHG